MIITEKIIVGDLGTNCYVVYNDDTKEGIIIDPGADEDKIASCIDSKSITPKAIFLTHGHFDHIMAAGCLASKYNVLVYAHECEKDILPDATLNLSGFYGIAYGIIANELLKDGQVIDIIGTKVKVLHTPGHTIGGCCYYFADEKMVFCGDTMFMESVGRTDFPTGNPDTIVTSLNNVILNLPEDVKAYPGHGPSTSIGYEKVNNPYVDGLY